MYLRKAFGMDLRNVTVRWQGLPDPAVCDWWEIVQSRLVAPALAAAISVVVPVSAR